MNQAEIPSSHFKPPISEVTDLGDRAFYAELNAKGRDSPVAPPRQGSEENLTLQEIFREAMVKIYAESKGFFPRALLSSLVTEACVFNELSNTLHQTHPQAQLQAYAETICKEILMPQDDDDNRHPRIKSFKKIFAILVLSEQTHRIIKFLEEDVNDLKLPLDKKLKGKNRTRFDLCLQKPEEESGGKTERKLECFQGWSPAAIERFEEWQWTMLAPFFHKGTRKDVQHFPLQGSVILPFTKDTRREDGRRHRTEMEGGQGRVFMVDIHPDHHNFDVPKVRCFINLLQACAVLTTPRAAGPRLRCEVPPFSQQGGFQKRGRDAQDVQRQCPSASDLASGDIRAIWGLLFDLPPGRSRSQFVLERRKP